MRKAISQFNVPAIELATLLISDGNNSDAIIHGIGPNPKENAIIKTHNPTIGRRPRVSSVSASAKPRSFKEKNAPKIKRPTAMKSDDVRRRIRRPSLSMTSEEMKVAII
uniref:Uncharacterized protein n=1 Tax=Photinus pyralis TaxID=7054 RepID=A0A1Y1KZA8_PHOPY